MKKVFLLMPAFFILCGCGGSKETGFQRTTEDGVEVIVNGLEPTPLPNEPAAFSLEDEIILDTEELKLTDVGFTGIEYFESDSHGNLYIISGNISKMQIYKFDSKGNFLHLIGRQGQGPGEYQDPYPIRIHDNDDISLFDGPSMRYMAFDSSGALKHEAKSTSKLFTFMGIFLQEGRYLIRKRENLDSGIRKFWWMILDENFEPLKQLDPEYFIELEASPRFNLIRDYELFLEILDGRIYAACNRSEEILIWIYDFDGRPLQKIRKAYKPVAIPGDFRKNLLERYKKSRLWEAYKLEGRTYIPDSFPPYKDIHVDGKGRIFLETYEEAGGEDLAMFHIFNPEGIFIGTAILEKSPMRRFRYGRMYSFHSKENGFEQIVVQRVIWE